LCAWREEGKSPLAFITFLRCIRPKEKEQLLLDLFNSLKRKKRREKKRKGKETKKKKEKKEGRKKKNCC